MFEVLRNLRERWNDWCGDREMELAIRKHLNENGFFGGTAKLQNVRLVAVQRPGWLQVFRFEATARVRPNEPADNEPADEAAEQELDPKPNQPPQYRQLFGLVRDDIRHKMNSVQVFEDEDQRRELFAKWSEDLICLRGAQGLSVR